MDVTQATLKIETYLKETFGKVVTLKDLQVERRSSGRVWMGTAYCVTRHGELRIGKIGVTENGEILGDLGVDELVAALVSLGRSDSTSEKADAFIAGLEDDFSDVDQEQPEENQAVIGILSDVIDEEEISFFQELNGSELKGRIIGLLTSGSDADLQEARVLMPKLLEEFDNRGDVLRQMGELEFRLGNNGLGLDYLEAASREFADIADIEALEQVVALTAKYLSPEKLSSHASKHLLDQTKERSLAIRSLSDVPAFKGLGEKEFTLLSGIADTITLDQGKTLLAEGQAAVQAFVIQSGILAIELQTPHGGSRVVRCCLPGELVGESCVLDVDNPTCNATVTAKESAKMWSFKGEALKSLSQEIPDLRARIEAKRTLHRLDSFFSMNEATNTLDVRIRDKLLGCISAIRHARTGDILESIENLPSAVYLVVTGQVEYRRPDAPNRTYGPDQFFCMKDTLHQLPLTGDMIATQPCRLVTFDPDALRLLAAEAPPGVVNVLERLE